LDKESLFKGVAGVASLAQTQAPKPLALVRLPGYKKTTSLDRGVDHVARRSWLLSVLLVTTVAIPLVAEAGGQVRCFGRVATIVGTPGDDTITGTTGPDVIAGLGGNDGLEGGDGNDRICGGAGGDGVDGDAGNDRVLGGSGNDFAFGGPDRDVVMGGTGNDGTSTGDIILLNCDEFSSGAGPSGERLIGGDGDDFLTGSDADDVLIAGPGNDALSGGPGHDSLTGSKGVDCFFAGDGADIISGGEGRDDIHADGDPPYVDGVDGGKAHDICRADPKDDTRNCP
jgi:Ca2+-binding RTX toxin-like protein